MDRKVRLAAPPSALAPPAEQALPDGPLGSVDIDSLSGTVLRRYAAKAGLPQHDVEGLTEDRLRQNVKLFIANHFELLSED